MTCDLFSLTRTVSRALHASGCGELIACRDAPRTESPDDSRMETVAKAWIHLCDPQRVPVRATPRLSWMSVFSRRPAPCMPNMTDMTQLDAVRQLCACVHKHRRLFTILVAAMRTDAPPPRGETESGARALVRLCHTSVTELDRFFSVWPYGTIPSCLRFHTLQLLDGILDLVALLANRHGTATVAGLCGDPWPCVLRHLAPPLVVSEVDATDDTRSHERWATEAFQSLTSQLMRAADNVVRAIRPDPAPCFADVLTTWAVKRIEIRCTQPWVPRLHTRSGCPACEVSVAVNMLALLRRLADDTTGPRHSRAHHTDTPMHSALTRLLALTDVHPPHICHSRKAVDALLVGLEHDSAATPTTSPTPSTTIGAPRAPAHTDAGAVALVRKPSSGHDGELDGLSIMLRSMRDITRTTCCSRDTTRLTEEQWLAAHAISAYLDSVPDLDTEYDELESVLGL